MLQGIVIRGNTPPNPLQPTIEDGIHLRWSVSARRGFPPFGFYLFRRHSEVNGGFDHDDLGDILRARGITTATTFGTEYFVFQEVFGRVLSDVPLRVVESPVLPGNIGFDLRSRQFVTVEFREPLVMGLVFLDFFAAGSITVTAFCDDLVVGQISAFAAGPAHIAVRFRAPKITSVRIPSGPAMLQDVFHESVDERAHNSWGDQWELMPASPTAFPYPMTLPVAHPNHPMTGVGNVENYAAARTAALNRVRYERAKYLALPIVELTRAGTVSVTSNSPIVVGTGTSFTPEMAGETFAITGQSTIYGIAEVLSPTRLVLNRAYASTTASALTYRITHDDFAELYAHAFALVQQPPLNPLAIPMVNISLPALIASPGTMSVTTDSNVVLGTGTNWTSNLVGLSFHVVRPYAGTVDVTRNQRDVFGVGTSWDESMVGALYTDTNTSGAIFVVEQVLSPTHLLLDRPHVKASSSNSSYTIIDSVPHRIASVVSATELRLESTYEGPSLTGARYRLFPRHGSATNAQVALMDRQYPMDLLLLGSLHPSIAQILGLYWVDRAVVPPPDSVDFYDYLIVADYTGVTQGGATVALDLVRARAWDQIEAALLPDMRYEATPGLGAPTNARAFVLPGAMAGSPNNVGVRWTVDSSPSGKLMPGRAVFYHLWRASLGTSTPSAPPAATSYTALTPDRPVVVVENLNDAGVSLPSPPDWPPHRLYAYDASVPEGWHSYAVSGVDVFGRHSGRSVCPWFQWLWAPPAGLGLQRPWYFTDPPGERSLHAFAVRVLDKTPPPMPVDVEASLLDPADPTVFVDPAYRTWRTANPSAIGLRVRWRYTQRHFAQAPDVKEFRVYYEPGQQLGMADPRAAELWQSRILVHLATNHLEQVTVGDQWVRQYEVFLNLGATVTLTAPSAASPIVYAHVGVSAADDKTHTADLRTTGPAGLVNRPGNEGFVGGPSKIFRVRRSNDTVMSVPTAPERAFASAPDYHGVSRYTFTWTVPSLAAGEVRNVHVFRALDESVFQLDWEQRPRTAIAATDLARFPAEWQGSGDAARRTAIAAKLNQLNGFAHDAAGTRAAFVLYRALATETHDALRVLASLPGNEAAFTQLTTTPIASSAGSYDDKLDGRSNNRYFYRAAFVDGANNLGPLTYVGAPVWLPDFTPPRVPRIVKAVGGNRSITVTWATVQREADLDEYRLYRSEIDLAPQELASAATLVATVKSSAIAANLVQFSATDATPRPLVDYRYYLTAVDLSGNSSLPARAVARAYDQTPPAPPTITTGQWVRVRPDGAVFPYNDPIPPGETREPAIRVVWGGVAAPLEARVQRRASITEPWQTPMIWTPGRLEYVDRRPVTSAVEYRIQARGAGGISSSAVFPVAGV